MTKQLNLKINYIEFVKDIITEIKEARLRTYLTVNKQLLELYWFIGRNIYEKVEIAQWGAGIVEKLYADLQKKFPDMKGFSVQNLWRMKQFYETYKDNEKLSPVVRELSWTHNLIILHNTETIEEKEFYLKTCINLHSLPLPRRYVP